MAYYVAMGMQQASAKGNGDTLGHNRSSTKDGYRRCGFWMRSAACAVVTIGQQRLRKIALTHARMHARSRSGPQAWNGMEWERACEHPRLAVDGESGRHGLHPLERVRRAVVPAQAIVRGGRKARRAFARWRWRWRCDAA